MTEKQAQEVANSLNDEFEMDWLPVKNKDGDVDKWEATRFSTDLVVSHDKNGNYQATAYVQNSILKAECSFLPHVTLRYLIRAVKVVYDNLWQNMAV